MSSTDYKKQFLSLLGEALKEQGFAFTRDPFYGTSFVRDRGDVRHFFDIDVRKKGDKIEVGSLTVGVRFDKVERKVAAYQEHLPFVTEKDLGRRRTLGTRLGWSAGGFWRKKWNIKDEPGVVKALKGVTRLVRKTGIPFLEKYSQVGEAMRMLAADDQEARRLTGPDANRAQTAIAMALLMKGIPAAIEMKNKKLQFLKSSNKDDYLEVSNWADKLFAAEGT